ncbi:MAG: EAL domain-containing protein [Pseudomonadota bacterium]
MAPNPDKLGLQCIFASLCLLLANAVSAEVVRVGVYQNPPKVLIDDRGRPSGFWPELTREMARREGWQIDWVMGSWEESLDRLARGEIDVMPDVAVTPERRERFEFTEQTVHVSWSQVYVMPGSAIETIPDLHGKRLGVLEDGVSLDGPDGVETLMEHFAVEADLVALNDYDSLFRQLRRGQLDAAVSNREFGRRARAQYGVSATPILFQPADLRYALAPDSVRTARLLSRIDHQLANMKGDDSSPFYQLQRRWLGYQSPTESILPRGAWWALVGILAGFVIALLLMLVVLVRIRRKAAQIRKERELIDIATRVAGMGAWSVDPATRRIFWTGMFANIHGAGNDFAPSLDEAFSFCAPEWRETARKQYQACLERGEAFDSELEIINASGERVWVRAVGEPVYNDDNRIVRVQGALLDIAHVKASELEAYRTANRLNNILESITDGFALFDRDWRFVYLNRMAEKILERSADQVLGMNVWKAFPETRDSKFQAELERSAKEHRAVEFEEFNPLLEKWFDVRAYPSEEGVAVYFVDISGQKKMLSRLNRLLESRRALIHSLPAHIALLDANGVIVEVNEQWRQFGIDNGYSGANSGLGRNYLQICDGAVGDDAEEAAAVAGGLRDVLAGRRSSFLMEYPCHSPGTERWFRLMINPLAVEEAGAELHGAVVMHIDITERVSAELERERLAFLDPLTGLLSRNGFVREVRQRLERSGWQKDAIVTSVDIAGMRDINDTHGYERGDELLVKVSERLQECIDSDGLVARTGGDEFVLFCHPRTGESVLECIESCIDAFSIPIELELARLDVDVRFGFTHLGETPRPVNDLLRESELALFSVHNQPEGAERWASFNDAMDHESRERIELTADLRQALATHQLHLHYQPKVDLETGELLSCEALLRWQHPVRGPQSPGVFIPIAEKSQLMGPIGDWVLREACRQLREWLDAGFQVVPVSINVSVVQFANGDWPDTVSDALEAYDLSPDLLVLEVTESVFGSESRSLYAQMHRLHDIGVRLSLDDFGTGYSSLLYLKQYPFDEIKIDQGFVRDLIEDDYSREIVAMVVKLAEAFGATAVAEGIETQAVQAALLTMDCRVGQGYYFSRPVAAEKFGEILLRGGSLPDRR